jgi:hypothetical protein
VIEHLESDPERSFELILSDLYIIVEASDPISPQAMKPFRVASSPKCQYVTSSATASSSGPAPVNSSRRDIPESDEKGR